MADLKEQVKEIIEIVALVPESLKTTCFELLLKEALAKRASPPPPPPSPPPAPAPTPKVATEADDKNNETQQPPATQPKVNDGSDIGLADIHMKTRKFLEKNDVTLGQLNNVFYKNDGTFEALFTDLGVTGMSEGQIRIAMLQSMHRALTDGEFVASVEAIREECKMRKCYDKANFTRIFKNNAATFDFGTWEAGVTEVRLSEQGKKELAAAIKTFD